LHVFELVLLTAVPDVVPAALLTLAVELKLSGLHAGATGENVMVQLAPAAMEPVQVFVLMITTPLLVVVTPELVTGTATLLLFWNVVL
jgi:hypothetical protein